jgi:apolipoprotein N-acyltransferase
MAILKRALALFAGGLIPLSLAPFNLLIFSFIGLTIFAWLMLQPQSQKNIFVTALLFGLGLFAVGVSWVYVSIHVYGEAAPVLAALMTLLFVLILAVLFAGPWLLLEFVAARPILQILGFGKVCHIRFVYQY